MTPRHGQHLRLTSTGLLTAWLGAVVFMGLGWLLAVFQTRSSPRILPSIGAAHRCGHQPFLLRCGTDLGAYGGGGGQQLQVVASGDVADGEGAHQRGGPPMFAVVEVAPGAQQGNIGHSGSVSVAARRPEAWARRGRPTSREACCGTRMRPGCRWLRLVSPRRRRGRSLRRRGRPFRPPWHAGSVPASGRGRGRGCRRVRCRRRVRLGRPGRRVR